MNFDEVLFHCSSLGYIMTENKEKSNLEKYYEFIAKAQKAKERYKKLDKEYSAFINQDTKTAHAKLSASVKAGMQYDKYCEEIKKLESIKDKVELSDTCKSHLMKIYVFTKYGRIHDIKTKYFDKGLILEEEAITTYSKVTRTYFEKNKLVKSNEYIIGEIDFPGQNDEIIHDTKVSWDIFTFWGSLGKRLEQLYYWQAQGYMSLWGIDKYKVVKVLLDTPKKLIDKEKQNLLRDWVGSEEDYYEACAELEKTLTYPDIPIEERIIEIPVERNDDDIAKISDRVKECRDFLNKIKTYNYEVDS